MITKVCPLCFSVVDDAFADGPSVQLSGQERLIVDALKRKTMGSTLDQLCHVVWDGEGPVNEHQAMRSLLSRVREKIRPAGWTITELKGGSSLQQPYQLVRDPHRRGCNEAGA